MSDTVIGTAVWVAADDLLPEQLHVICACGDGKNRATWIPVYPKGGVKQCVHQWAYEICGDELAMSPSLNWVGVFHNAGSWRVRFVRHDRAEHGSVGLQLKAVNPGLEFEP